MKTKNVLMAFTVVGLIGLNACKDAPKNIETQVKEMAVNDKSSKPKIQDNTTIVGVAASNDNFTTLVAAVKAAGLVETLNSAGPFTVFAPTDGAFAALLLELDDTGSTSLGDLDPALVEAVLRTHVLADNVRSSELTTTTVNAINMEELDIDATALTITDPRDRVSNIVASLIDIQGINGVVHVIDTVLLPTAE